MAVDIAVGDLRNGRKPMASQVTPDLGNHAVPPTASTPLLDQLADCQLIRLVSHPLGHVCEPLITPCLRKQLRSSFWAGRTCPLLSEACIQLTRPRSLLDAPFDRQWRLPLPGPAPTEISDRERRR